MGKEKLQFNLPGPGTTAKFAKLNTVPNIVT